MIRKMALDGKKLPKGRIVALNNEPGYQARTLGPGYHLWYGPWMFKIIKDQLRVIRPGRLGLVVARDGDFVRAERIIGKFVSCNNFQDADQFLLKGGQKGKQGAVLTAGSCRINRILFDVTKTEVTTVETGRVGIVTATDGAPIPAGELGAPVVAGHESLESAVGDFACWVREEPGEPNIGADHRQLLPQQRTGLHGAGFPFEPV